MNELLVFGGTILCGLSIVIVAATWNTDIREPERITPYIFTVIAFIGYMMIQVGLL